VSDFSARNLDSLVLPDLLQLRAKSQSNKAAYIFLNNGEKQQKCLTHGELDLKARAIAAYLQSHVSPGERALLLYPSGLEFIAAFFGCLYAGIIAVPAYLPQSQKHLSRLETIASDANATVALTTSQILSNKSNRLSKLPALSTLKWLETDKISDEWAAKWQSPNINSDTLAFLQYTSGSTGNPKGVMVSHRNLMHNEHIIKQGFGHTERSIIVGWLPLFHDMGLIGNVLQPLYLGARCILMSPEAFLQRPIRWLKAISDFKATTSGGPNFAYELCVRKIAPEERQLLDLSSWDVAFNGAEPVRAETLNRFSKTFEPCGFRRKAFYPCYGMAETTLIVTGGDKTDQAIVHNVDSTALSHARISTTASGFEGSQKLVGCGQPLPGMDVTIAHPENLTRCAPHEVGEIWVKGNSVTRGYWQNSEATEQTFQAYLKDTDEGPFLKTGDLGYLHNGELFITGRLKDLIIIRGRNYYPQDIEQTAQESHPALQLNGGASFSVEIEGEEQLIIVHEVQRTYLRKIDANEVMNAIRQAISETHQLSVHSIVLLKPGGLPKTSSGKVQRTTCKTKFLENSLEPIATRYLETGDTVTQPEEELLENLLKLEPEKRFQQLVAYLQQLIAYVLGVNPKRVDINQSLTALGVDSLNTLELQHQIEEKLAISLPMSTILQSSITNFAEAVLEKLLLDANEPSFIEIGHSSTSQVLSYGQRALWFVHQLAPKSTAYHVSYAVKIRASLDVTALQRAFEKLIERHTALRTNFSSISGEPIQKVHETGKVDFRVEEASTWSEENLNERLQIESNSSFDLENDALLRVRVFTLSSGEHLLLLTIHHIVIDFWSLAVVMDELSILYLAEQNGKAASLPLLPISFQDYSDWQSGMIDSPKSEKLGNYWQKQLSGDLPILGLHSDRPRPSVQTYNGNSVHLRLDKNLTKQLEDLSRNCGVTLYMTLLAAFQVLLFRYTGQEDILVGSPTNGRTHKDFAGLVGYFVNPIVLRGNLAGSPTFETFLSQVRQTVLDAFEHQDYPFALLVEKLQPNRDPSCTPIFQTMFVFQKSPRLDDTNLAAMSLGETGVGMTWGNLPVESYALPQRTAQFDLTLAMASVGNELLASFEYNTDLFDTASIERMSSHFQVLLKGIIEKPDRSVSLLPLIPEIEQQKLLQEWNTTQKDYPREFCIHSLFEKQAELTPNAIAVVLEDKHLTYLELNQRANQVARHLRTLGVGVETLVGICVERSLEMVVGVLGILKAGATYVPLDPAYPLDRLTFMLEDAQISVLLSQNSIISSLNLSAKHIVCLDSEANTFKHDSSDNLENTTATHNLAYVIYTSGSTGQPKGVMVPHSSIVNRLFWGIEQYQLKLGECVLQKTSLSFDVSVWEIFGTLLAGSCLVLARPDGHQDPSYLVKVMVEQSITHVDFVPAMLKYVLDEPGIENCSSLRYVTCGGESLPLAIRDRFFEKLPGVELHNCYGPTEVSIDTTSWVCDRNSPTVSIGRPIANQEVYILDEFLQPVPIGVAGELYVGGIGLARGYLNRPDLTAEKFIRHPFKLDENARLYRTGDLARFLPDENIDFLGRLDNQVKIRGFRVEIDEIARSLQNHSAVEEAVVVQDNSISKRLIAYISPKQGDRELSTTTLRTYLSQHLPDYMLPSAFVTMPKLPRTPNGKLDYRALPVPDNDSWDRSTHFIPPQNPLQKILADIWGEILKIEHISIHDNFFELGGHSLLAIQVNSRLRDMFQMELSVQSLFEATTIEKLSQLLITKENKPGQIEKIAQLLQQIDSMSAEEVKKTLMQKQKEAGEV
jgi:amino acid adenylation domain-containing protein